MCERGRIHIKQVLKICKAIYHQIHCHLHYLSPFSTLESKENGHKVARRNEKAKIRQVTKSHFKSPFSFPLIIWEIFKQLTSMGKIPHWGKQGIRNRRMQWNTGRWLGNIIGERKPREKIYNWMKLGLYYRDLLSVMLLGSNQIHVED